MLQSLLFHPKTDGFDGIRTLEPEAFFLVVLHEFGEQFETVAIGSSGRGIVGRQPIYLGQVSPLLVVRVDDFRLEHHKYQFMRFVYSA